MARWHPLFCSPVRPLAIPTPPLHVVGPSLNRFFARIDSPPFKGALGPVCIVVGGTMLLIERGIGRAQGFFWGERRVGCYILWVWSEFLPSWSFFFRPKSGSCFLWQKRPKSFSWYCSHKVLGPAKETDHYQPSKRGFLGASGRFAGASRG